MKTQATCMHLVFSYGSNMRLKRLQARCTTAQFVTTAYVEGYTLRFNKKRIDGSGKKNLIPVQDAQQKAWGVVFQFSNAEIDKLEGKGKGYEGRGLSNYTIQNKD